MRMSISSRVKIMTIRTRNTTPPAAAPAIMGISNGLVPVGRDEVEREEGKEEEKEEGEEEEEDGLTLDLLTPPPPTLQCRFYLHP